MLQDQLKSVFFFSHGETQWNPPAENLVSYGIQGRPSVNIYNVQSRMDTSLEWVDTASSMIIKDVSL